MEEKFKVGDRVHHEIYGKGTIVELNYGHSDFLVEFDNENEQLNNGNGWGSNNYRDKHCWWCLPYQVTKLEQIVIKDIDGGEHTYDIDLSGLTLNLGGVLYDKTSSKNERKEEKENMENRVYSILNIYEQNRLKEMNEEYEKKEQEITKGDSILKDVRAFEKTLRKKYSNDNISLRTDYLSKETSDILAELYGEKVIKEKKLYEYKDEVKAQIRLCDTYDQVIDILVSYGIIDKKTKKIN